MTQPVEFAIHSASADTAQALREYAMRRLSVVLRHFERRIHSVRIRISDLNGPKGGVDTSCSMVARLAGGREVVVEARTATPFASIAKAATRLRAAVTRQLGG